MGEDTSPGLASVIAEAIRTSLVDVHTALPGRVESYDSSRQVADVKPMLRRVIRRENMDRVAEELPVIPCVPVVWSRGGGAFVSLPLAAGDSGLLVFSEYTLDRWRSTGDDVDPGDERRHDLSGAVFVPGLFPSSETIADTSDSEVRIGLDGDYVAAISGTEARFPHNATEFLARADRVLSELQDIATDLSGHTHTAGALLDSTAGACTGSTGPSTATYTPTDPSSDTVKGT